MLYKMHVFKYLDKIRLKRLISTIVAVSIFKPYQPEYILLLVMSKIDPLFWTLPMKTVYQR